jgi:hypothetical protein
MLSSDRGSGTSHLLNTRTLHDFTNIYLAMKDNNLISLISLTYITRSLAYFEHVISSFCAICQVGKSQQANAREQ